MSVRHKVESYVNAAGVVRLLQVFAVPAEPWTAKPCINKMRDDLVAAGLPKRNLLGSHLSNVVKK